MWKLVVLVLVSVLTISCHSKKNKSTDVVEIPILQKMDNINSLGLAEKTIFETDSDICRLRWEVSHPKKKKGQLYLSVQISGSTETHCKIPFEQQVPFHRAALKAVFSQWPKSQFKNFFGSGFRSYSPDQLWSVQLARRSFESEDWKDYRRNYPKNKSGKGPHQILLDLANKDPMIYSRFNKLFNEFGLQIELYEVEKISTSRARDLPHRELLKNVPDNFLVLIDASTMRFRIRGNLNSANETF